MKCFTGFGAPFYDLRDFLINDGLFKESILRIPGVPAVLVDAGLTSIRVDAGLRLNWEAHGIYNVKVNGGGLISEAPLDPEPILGVIRDYNPWEGIRELLDWLYGGGDKGLLNPLSWRPILPVGVEGDKAPIPCITIDGVSYSSRALEPLKPAALAKCREASFSEKIEGIELGGFRVEVEGDGARYPGIYAVRLDDGLIVGTSKSLILDLERGAYVRIYTGARDYRVASLYAFTFHEEHYRGDSACLLSNVIVITTPRGSLSIASRSGIRAFLEPGFVTIRLNGVAGLALGGEIEAYRLLLEQAVIWEPVVSRKRGLGHLRSSASSALIEGSGKGYISIKMANPTRYDGLVEIVFPSQPREVIVDSLLGRDEYEPQPIARVPTPRGYCGLIKASFKRFSLKRLQ